MKIQIESGQWRVRVLEHDLNALLEGNDLTICCALPDGEQLGFVLRLSDQLRADLSRKGPDWMMTLPRAEVAELQARLPDREGIAFELDSDPSGFRLLLQVDVKDSVRKRRQA